MNKKEMYASIEVANHEVRLAISESHKTRFNTLRAEKAPIQGVGKQEIMDERNVINDITKAKKQAEDALGHHTERVLATILSVNVQRHNEKVSVVPEANGKCTRLSNIQKGLNGAVSFKLNPQLELVSISCAKYITSGITSRKIPIGEITGVLIMNVNLLYMDKEVMYVYTCCTKKAGLGILDVCLDSYTMANETVVFEQIVNKYIIQINLVRDHTTPSLFTHGKLMNCEVVEDGYGVWLQDLIEQYHLSSNVSCRLAQDTCTFDVDSVRDQTTYIWSKSGEQKQTSKKQAREATVPYMKNQLSMINETYAPIIESGDVRYLLSGEDCEIPSLQELLCYLNAPAQIYVPQTIGVRSCSYVAHLGPSYSWREQMIIRRDERVCCSPQEVEETVDMATEKSSVDEEGGFIKKLKSILLSDK